MKTAIFKNFNEVIENKDILKILDDIKPEPTAPPLPIFGNRLRMTRKKPQKEPKNFFRHSRPPRPSKEDGKWNF